MRIYSALYDTSVKRRQQQLQKYWFLKIVTT